MLSARDPGLNQSSQLAPYEDSSERQGPRHAGRLRTDSIALLAPGSARLIILPVSESLDVLSLGIKVAGSVPRLILKTY